MNRLLHTPEGVRDIYNEEYRIRQKLMEQMMTNISSYGYESIATPTFEFFDVFGKDIGTNPSKNLYKFFDREGNTLVLRPDFTPSVARAASKYFSDEKKPIRLSYAGNVFLNTPGYQGRLHESTQLGAEFIGDDSLDADSEMIAMACSCLISAGLKDFKISIGHASIFGGLVAAASFNEDEIDELKELILNKNFFGVEEFIQKKSLSEELKTLFLLLKRFYSAPEEWAQMIEAAQNYPMIRDALFYLEKLNDLLKVYGVDSYVSYEMGLLSPYRYYTGVIFSGYTYGSGEPIIKGGRYDRLLKNFGKDVPAIGFAVFVESLQLAIDRQKIAISTERQMNVILYKKDDRKKAITVAKRYRDYGKIVLLRRITDSETKEQLIKEYAAYDVEVVEGE